MTTLDGKTVWMTCQLGWYETSALVAAAPRGGRMRPSLHKRGIRGHKFYTAGERTAWQFVSDSAVRTCDEDSGHEVILDRVAPDAFVRGGAHGAP